MNQIDKIFFNPTFLSIPRHEFSQIKDYDARYLEQVVSLKEICMALFNANAWKALGPDEFQPSFYQVNWDIIGDILYNFVHQIWFRLGK